MSKFIVVSDQLTTVQQDAITSHVQARGWKVWHWYEATWLLAGVPDDWTPKMLHSELDAIESVAGAKVLVIEVSGPTAYWGRSPEPSWRWMAEEWGSPHRPRP